ncbi:hypothetical protein N7603_06370 [Acholeplasma vituli]|uniref:DUF177 domain-containing protein n=1 Tax=Paracholeplasma vituli TaxID=69473 RepID=A0ABT2PWE4_9MOLU|nr:hypothetical protein [Paracholeplasma vituli]MCU0105279.1 hypothetical protein [Paracholeplasma vituli]
MILTLEKLKTEYANQGMNLTLDFKNRLKDQTLMYDIDLVKVTGQVQFLQSRYVHFDLTIETTLTLPCAITLKPVIYPLSFKIEEDVSETSDAEYRIIEDKIHLGDIVWGAIIPMIPMQVYAEDAPRDQFEEEPKINEVFAQLKDHFDKK